MDHRDYVTSIVGDVQRVVEKILRHLGAWHEQWRWTFKNGGEQPKTQPLSGLWEKSNR